MPLEAAFGHLAAADCTEVEIAAMPRYLPRAASIRSTVKKKGLNVTAVSLGVPFFFSGSRLDLHSPRESVRKASIRYVCKSIDFASDLQAGIVYVCSMSSGESSEPGRSLEHLRRAVNECSGYAKGAGVRFAIEPFPGGVLPTVRETSAFIRETESDNLGVLLDTGHAAISGERLTEAARLSKESIFHVHVNNNDGVNDLHWEPQRGKLTAADYSSFLEELDHQHYRGKISIELSRPGPIARTITRSRRFVEEIMDGLRSPAWPGSRISS